MTRREQELIDQHRAWRSQLDAMPEQPWEAPPPPDVPPREQRLAEIRARRADRISRPTSSPEAVATKPEPRAVSMTRVVKLDAVITPEDADFAAWRRRRPKRGQGTRRAARERT